MVNNLRSRSELLSKEQLSEGLRCINFENKKVYHFYFQASTRINSESIDSVSIFKRSDNKIAISAGEIGNYIKKCKLNTKPIFGDNLEEVLEEFLSGVNGVTDLSITKVMSK